MINKFCVDCRHFVPTGQMCRPEWRRSLVTGAVLEAVPAWDERYMPQGLCGPEGGHWEKNEQFVDFSLVTGHGEQEKAE